jgi:hypothetical protein
MRYIPGSRKASTVLGLITALFALSLLALPSPSLAQVVGDGPIKGSIKVTQGANLQDLAKITIEQARDAALKHLPDATYQEGQLEEEDGYLIYDIELIQNGKEVEVAVDAGNAAILQVDHDNEDD